MQRTSREDRWRAREEGLRQLLLAGLAGDQARYQEFLTELGTYLRAFLRKRLIQLPDEVEDLLQESLIAVHNNRHTYDAGQPLSAWVQAIARYKLADFLRRRAAHAQLTRPLDDDEAFFSNSDEEAAHARRDLGKLLDELPDRYRLPIIHTRLEGLSVEEAARLTGLSESAIKVGVHRGLKALAAIIRGTK